MTVKRVFIAIDLSDAAREACARHIEVLRRRSPNVRIGWERREKLHITLKFLGDTDEQTVPDICRRVAAVVAERSRPRLRLTATGAFPNARRPRILWVGAEDLAGQIGPLEKKIEEACVSLGFAREGRKFKPHVTIGRIRPGTDARDVLREHLQMQVEPVEFEVTHVTIYESKLGPTGSSYEVLGKFALRAA